MNESLAGNDSRLNMVRELLPDVTLHDWSLLDEQTRTTLYNIAHKYHQIVSRPPPPPKTSSTNDDGVTTVTGTPGILK